MLILREYFQKCIGSEIFADCLEWQTYGLLAFHPQIDRRHLMAVLHDGAGEIELSVKFQGSGLNRQRSRCRARFGRLVHDPDFCPELAKPERKHQARRAGTDYQNVTSRHVSPPTWSLISVWAVVRASREVVMTNFGKSGNPLFSILGRVFQNGAYSDSGR